MKTSVIIPAGGVGTRFGGDLPKQFVELAGAPILVHTIRIFDNIDDVESIVISVHNEWFTYTKELIKKFDCKKVTDIVLAGKERQDSVANGLHTKSVQESEIVLVHDAVRPFASPALVQKLIDEAEELGAVIPVTEPKETIKERNNKDMVVRTLDRTKLAMVQTPQAFWYDVIKTAYEKAAIASYKGTDDSSLVEFIGYKVSVIEGEEENLKITDPFDMRIAELILNEHAK
mgnify:CR=1 FL=1